MALPVISRLSFYSSKIYTQGGQAPSTLNYPISLILSLIASFDSSISPIYLGSRVVYPWDSIMTFCL